MAIAPLTLSEKDESSSAAARVRAFPPSTVPLDLMAHWPQAHSRPQWLKILAASAILHIFFFFGALQLPSFVARTAPEQRVIVKMTPLYLPPDVLTQKAPNRQKISKTIDLADLVAAPSRQAVEAAPRPSRKKFEIPQQTVPRQTANAAPRILPEAPKIAMNQPVAPPPAGVANGLPVAAPPPPTPTPGPFQNIGSDAPLNPHPTLVPPKPTIQAAINGLAQNAPGRHLVVTDDNASEPTPRIPGSVGQGGAPHAAVELQSDPQGADFKPYLMRILSIVRANWRRVIPESARMGTLRGRTVMEFIIDRNGSIPKIVTADSSGSEPLDRAALAGLSMSNPLPPLPADFKGFQVRLAFSFTYNMPAQ